MRIRVAALVVLLYAQALGAQSTSLRFRFIGNEAFAITDGTSSIVTDFPYESGYSGYMTYRWEDAARTTGDTVCLITHGHRDHFDAPLAEKLGCRVAGPQQVLARVPEGQRIPVSSPFAAGAARVTAFETPHMPARGAHYSYLVEWKGVRMFFVGDTEDTSALLAQKDLDIAFVTPWLWHRVQQGRGTISARRIVFYHHEAGEALPPCVGCVSYDQNQEFSWPR